MDKLGLIKLTFDGTKTVISRLLFNQPASEKILDPMSTIIRLAIISYRAPGTKISIHNNSMYFQNPDFLQVPLRMSYSDNRSDLHNLHNPILKSLEWYDLKHDYMQHIFRLAQKGLKQLKDCYKSVSESNLVCHSLDYYSKMIDVELGKYSKDKNTLSPVLDYNLNVFTELNGNVYNNNGITKLKDYWTYNEFKLISEMFKVVDEYNIRGDDNKPILSSIHRIVKGKDLKVQDLIIKLTTTLTS